MFLFRADGNPNIGAGHIMRCLSIADAAAAAGESCLFITADHYFSEVVTKRGHQVSVLDTDYTCMEKELENGLLQEFIPEVCPRALFVDSYFVTFEYLLTLKKMCRESSCKLVYIDDVLAFPYPVDYLINYNIYGPDKKTEYEQMYLDTEHKAEMPYMLLGTEFAPLRKEFQNLPDRTVKREAKNILISTGGSDPEHISVEIADYIGNRADSRLKKFHFHLIAGAMNQDFHELQKMTERIPNITLHHNVTDMQRLMSACDVAISAAGSTLYELCATQTPVITYILADNQIPGAMGFERHGVLKCVGDVRAASAGKLAADVIEAAAALADDYEERVRIAAVQKSVVDGKGAGRICGRIK